MLRTCTFVLCVTAVLTDEEWLDVVITQGPVRGRLLPNQDVYAFYNIPYATAPTGIHKFKAPLLPPKWFTPRECIDRKIICPQNVNGIERFLPERLVAQENCLIANVFVPKDPKEHLSVLVYVHGGGFSLGYGNSIKGTQIMKRKDIILVTFNYRLGAPGFLCLGTTDIPGNAGMKDQVALLRWVQENIAGFGGNPREVTIAGSSAGSASVDLIMLSKLAKGLFHRVIPESGGSLAAFAVQRDPITVAKIHARRMNFTNVDDFYALEEFYKTAPLELLFSDLFFDRYDSTFLFSPCVERDSGDEAFLTESPLSILMNGNYDKLPILYGFTSMEGLMRIDYFDIWKHKMNEKFSDFLPADLKFPSEKQREEVGNLVKRFYFNEKFIDDSNIMAFINFFSDIIITYPMLRAAKLYVEAGNNQVYLYEYTFLSRDSNSKVRGSDHCAQSTAWLDDVDGENGSFVSPEYRNMRNTVRRIWHNFIRTGKPVPEGSSLATWLPAGRDRSPHMNIGEKLVLSGDVLLKERTDFWDAIYQIYYSEAVPPTLPTESRRSNIPVNQQKSSSHICPTVPDNYKKLSVASGSARADVAKTSLCPSPKSDLSLYRKSSKLFERFTVKA